jgi:Tol biopolymer transport system component
MPVSRAVAEFGPIALDSKTGAEQADFAEETAISGDGRYLAFRARIGGRQGIFREDLQTGALVPVFAGSAYEGAATERDAKAPSISASGRFVSFTTKASLDPGNDDVPSAAADSDVYVADTDSKPPSYELASALDNSSVGLRYGSAAGSLAAGRVALSADGRKVAFVIAAVSDLTEPGTVGTPEKQVVLRDLAQDRTILVSAVRDPSTGAMTQQPVPTVSPPIGIAKIGAIADSTTLGAALSGDGTTVAWLGAQLPAQVPLLSGEVQAQKYDEPLWRRIADGPTAPTRRVLGGGDPLAPGCPPGGTLQDPPCQGPFPGIGQRPSANSSFNGEWQGWLGSIGVDGIPQLSADGRTVALVGNPEEVSDLFLVDMHAGLSRDQALRQLTRGTLVDPLDPENTINKEPYVRVNGHIFDLAISADGRRIALATARQRFPLAPPALLGSPPPDVGQVELYRLDLDEESLERITPGFDGSPSLPFGEPSNGEGASSPSFSDDGRTIAFASDANNLTPGDANEASDAFTVEESPSPPSGSSLLSPPPPGPRLPRPRWRLYLTASPKPNGSVRLYAAVPGAGTLDVRARRADPAVTGGPSHLLLVERRQVRRARVVALALWPRRRYRRLLHSPGGLPAVFRVSFSSRGHRSLHGTLEAVFAARSAEGGEDG